MVNILHIVLLISGISKIYLHITLGKNMEKNSVMVFLLA